MLFFYNIYFVRVGMWKFLKFDIVEIFLYIYYKLNVMEKIILQIKSGEGGKDANLLVKEMAEIYKRTVKVENFKIETIEEKNGFTSYYL